MVHKNNSRTTKVLSFSQSFDDRADLIITPVEISNAGSLERIQTKALWDTGSNISCIISELAGILGLQPKASASLTHVGNKEGRSLRNAYLIDIFLTENISYKSIMTSEISDQDGVYGEYGIVIGMDIIKTGNFILENISGKTKMYFRTSNLNTGEGFFVKTKT